MMEFSQLQRLLEHATGREASPFYRRFYGLPDKAPPLSVKNWDEWRAIPLLGKEDLLKVSLPERAFPPWSNVVNIVASSGTSGKPPLFSSMPLSERYSFRFAYHPFARATLASLPTPHRKEWEIRRMGRGRVIAFDAKRSRACVRLARDAGADSLIVFLFHIPLIAEEMRALGMNESILYIEIAGERCSETMYRYMRKMFPNATILSEYGSTDVEATPIGIPCRPLTDSEPREVFHTTNHIHLELIDHDTGDIVDPRAGVEADILITGSIGTHASFPLLRYKHGDTIRILGFCTEHEEISFQVLGRRDLDFVKIPGGVLRADEIERVLRLLGEGDEFQVRVREILFRERPSVSITLFVPHARASLKALAEKLSATVRIGNAYTLADAARDGLFSPLECREAPIEAGGAKKKRIVRE